MLVSNLTTPKIYQNCFLPLFTVWHSSLQLSAQHKSNLDPACICIIWIWNLESTKTHACTWRDSNIIPDWTLFWSSLEAHCQVHSSTRFIKSMLHSFAPNFTSMDHLRYYFVLVLWCAKTKGYLFGERKCSKECFLRIHFSLCKTLMHREPHCCPPKVICLDINLPSRSSWDTCEQKLRNRIHTTIFLPARWNAPISLFHLQRTCWIEKHKYHGVLRVRGSFLQVEPGKPGAEVSKGKKQDFAYGLWVTRPTVRGILGPFPVVFAGCVSASSELRCGVLSSFPSGLYILPWWHWKYGTVSMRTWPIPLKLP